MTGTHSFYKFAIRGRLNGFRGDHDLKETQRSKRLHENWKKFTSLRLRTKIFCRDLLQLVKILWNSKKFANAIDRIAAQARLASCLVVGELADETSALPGDSHWTVAAGLQRYKLNGNNIFQIDLSNLIAFEKVFIYGM